MVFCLMSRSAQPMTEWAMLPLNKVAVRAQAASKTLTIFSARFLAAAVAAALPICLAAAVVVNVKLSSAGLIFAMSWKSVWKKPLRAKTSTLPFRLQRIASVVMGSGQSQGQASKPVQPAAVKVACGRNRGFSKWNAPVRRVAGRANMSLTRADLVTGWGRRVRKPNSMSLFPQASKTARVSV